MDSSGLQNGLRPKDVLPKQLIPTVLGVWSSAQGGGFENLLLHPAIRPARVS